MTTTQSHVDLQIVGGGLAGLIAANLAVDAGLSVRMIEKQPTAGGRAVTADHHGFRLNLGPHALYVNGALKATLERLGIDPIGAEPALDGAIGTVGATTGELPYGAGSLARTSLLSTRSKLRYGKVLLRVPRMDPGPLASVTVDEWLDSLTDAADLRAVLNGFVNLSTYNTAADLASADAALIQLQMALKDSVLYLADGWGSIVAALEARLAGARAFERVTGAVTAVDEEPGGSVCRVADGGTAGADGEPGGSSHRATVTLLAPGSPVAVDRLIGTDLSATAGPPVEASVMDLGLRARPSVSAHFGFDRSLYYSLHSVADGLAPEGQALVVLARYRRPGDDLGPDETKAALLAHAEASGIGDDDIVMQRYLHKLTVAGGMPMASTGGLPGRPPVRVPGHPGLLVAGDWVGPEGLLADASAASAVAAVEAARVMVGTATRSGGRSVASARTPEPVRR